MASRGTQAQSLSIIHYWHFNTLITAYHNPGIPALKADYSAIDPSKALCVYTLVPGASANYAGYIDNNAGGTTNARLSTGPGQALRFRNPSDSSELRFTIPTTNFKNIVINYALESSSTTSGMLTELFDYSPDGGTTWKKGMTVVGQSRTDSLDVSQTMYQGALWGLVTLTFPVADSANVNNNPNLVFRIKFRGNTSGSSGNNRFDNFTVEGTYAVPVAASIQLITPTATDTLFIGHHFTISFLGTGSLTSNFTIDYSVDDGNSWTTVATVPSSATSYDWIVPNTPSPTSMIRVKDGNNVVGQSPELTIKVKPPVIGPANLMYYWDFNSFLTVLNNPSIPAIKCDYSGIDTNKGYISYFLYAGASANFPGYLDNVVGTDSNKRVGSLPGQGFRVRNPTDSMDLRIHLSTKNYKDIHISWAAETSGITTAPLAQNYDYSLDAGLTWKTAGLDHLFDSITDVKYQGTSWAVISVNLTNVAGASDNANLVFRIRFGGNTSNLSGNNRFDNLVVEGTPIVAAAAAIVVKSPGTGDSLFVGRHSAIGFSTAGPVTEARDINYSVDGGTTWTKIASVASTFSYDWVVPNTPTTNGMIQVVDGNKIAGTSGKFSIIAPGAVSSLTVALTAGKLTGGQPTMVSWVAAGYLGQSVDVEYSYDNKTWMPINLGYAFGANSSCSWNVPNENHTGVVVRVKFASGSTMTSAPFDIAKTAGVAREVAATASHVWPNPFSKTAEVEYNMALNGNVTLVVFDMTGNEVAHIANGMQTAGTHRMTIDGSQLAEGTYFYTLSTGSTMYQGKLSIVR